MEKVLLNSDVINSCDHIYFNLEGNFFEMATFSIENDLIESINKAYKELRNMGYITNTLFIPFAPYNNFVIQKDKKYPFIDFDCKSLDEMLKEIFNININIIVLIPDCLKNKCKPTI